MGSWEPQNSHIQESLHPRILEGRFGCIKICMGFEDLARDDFVGFQISAMCGSSRIKMQNVHAASILHPLFLNCHFHLKFYLIIVLLFSTDASFETKHYILWRNRFVSTFLMWRNFSTTWQSVMWRNFITWQNVPPQALPVVSVTHIRYGSCKKEIFQNCCLSVSEDFFSFWLKVALSPWCNLWNVFLFWSVQGFLLQSHVIPCFVWIVTAFSFASMKHSWYGYIRTSPWHCSICISSFISSKTQCEIL